MKYIIIFINALAIAIYHFLFGDPVSIAAQIPDNIQSGTSFTVSVTVNKPQVTGFAKLQLEIPPGYVATEIESKGGSFTASGTVVKVIWTSVPSDDQLTLLINIAVPASAVAGKQLKGKFSYITNNAKQEATFDPLPINISGSSGDAAASTQASADSINNSTTATIQPTTQSDASTQTITEPVATNNQGTTDNQQSFSKPNEPDATVSVSRKITGSGTPDNFQVDVIIKKENIKGFAKLSEKIPVGYKAEQTNIAGASFSFENGEAKFIWTSIPSSEEITISYNLSPDASGSIQKPAYIDGSKFSYIETDQTKKILLEKQEITDGESGAAVATNTPLANTNTQPDNTTANTSTTVTQPDNTAIATTTAVAPKNGNIHYSVQIGAFQKSVNANYLKRKYSIIEAVRTEMHDGYTKCILGRYNEYKAARDSRETTKNKGVGDAFVTAYNSGKRITVQEALMVSNQKWYK
jgi:cell division septation protein DedD